MTPQNKHKKLPKNAAKIADAFQHYGYKQGYSKGIKQGREEILKEIIEEFGYMNDGCGCCMGTRLSKALEEKYPLLSNNPQDE